jgi:hypothetical protein
MDYTLVAISKNTHGTIIYSVIKTSTRDVIAIVKSISGHPFDIKFIESTPTEVECVMAFVREEERKQRL